MAIKSKRKGEVQSRVERGPVLYSMNVGHFMLEPVVETVVQLEDGSYGRVTNNTALTVSRDGGMNELPHLPPYYPDNPEDAAIIERLDLFIKQNPMGATQIGLARIDKSEIGKPAPAWNDPDVTEEAIYNIILHSGVNAEIAMRYELAKEEPRQFVIDAIERAAKVLATAAADASEEAPEL